jgi:hypothetical protein
LGSYLEFKKNFQPGELEEALKMPGGGIFKLDPG